MAASSPSKRRRPASLANQDAAKLARHQSISNQHFKNEASLNSQFQVRTAVLRPPELFLFVFSRNDSIRGFALIFGSLGSAVV